jgi:hypothetical protein
MKTKLIYVLISLLVLALVSCDDSIEDASSKHVYGEDENPYLKSDIGAIIGHDIEFEVGRFEPQVVSLEDYADVFQTKMDLTVDEVIAGLKNGSVVFCNINTSRRHWDKSAPTKGESGWYYNSAGGITDDEQGYVASLELDENEKQLIIDVNAGVEAGAETSFNVGFALNGRDYDHYVRFSFNVAVTDPSLIITSVQIPEGDYAAAVINLLDYAEVIEYNMGVGVEEFLANLDANEGGTIHLYVVDKETGEWDAESGYTANPPGYWMNAAGEVCSWGDDGFTLYGEVNLAEGVLNIGRAPELPAGKSYKISLGFKDANEELNFIRFIITVTLD